MIIDDLKVVGEKAAAEILDVSIKTLQGWRWAGRGPRYYKIGRLVKYRLEDLKEFVDRQLVDKGE